MAVLLLADVNDGQLATDAVAKALSAVKALGEVHVLVAGTSAAAAAEAAKLDGAAKVLHANDGAYDHGMAEPIAALIVGLAGNYSHIAAAATAFSKNVLPRVAALLDVMVISDVTAVVDADTFERPIYAGNAVQTVTSADGKKVGISVAYFLATRHGIKDITLIDQGQPMAFTSAQSGENYRDWWPHAPMVRFMKRSIDLMEEIARHSGNRINLTRRGYVLATRAADIAGHLQAIQTAFGTDADLRLHDGRTAPSYQPPRSSDWQAAPAGFDILSNSALIQSLFPYFDPSLRHIIHVRRAGDISGQQLGQYMLERLRVEGAQRLTAMVKALDQTPNGWRLTMENEDGITRLDAQTVVNAAGPLAADVAAMIGIDLPIYNVVQQKISFPDTEAAIPRDMPFSIDLNGQTIDWTEEERALLRSDPATAFLAEPMPGAIHCRPDGGDAGTWIKLGWAFNTTKEDASWKPTLRPDFPEIVLRGAARLNPALRRYYGRLPRQMHHYGGFYTRTDDNWPLIGPMGPAGAFMAVGLSGHGTMAACATGELTAAWITGNPLPDYARAFSLQRYEGKGLGPGTEESGLL